MNRFVISAIIYGVILNILVSVIASRFATSEEITPTCGPPGCLNFKGQVMHTFVHHTHVLASSSFIIAVVVGLAACLATKIPLF